MKSKLFKVLGVVAVVAMLATALVAPAAALVHSVFVVSDTAINATYYLYRYFTLGVHISPRV